MNAELIWTVPLAGALVGWLTNVIAIEMLFRPKIPMYLLGMRIPFTPGLLPINQKQIIDSASKHVSSVIIDSLETSSQDANHLKLFNSLLDAHWSTYIFIPPSKRASLYRKLCKTVSSQKNTRYLIEQIIKNQMSEYNVDRFEKVIRKLADDSLKGIKIVGAFLGAFIGMFTILL